MEYLVVSQDGEVVAGLKISDSGNVSFPVPFRLILVKDIIFENRSDWNSNSLEEFINAFGNAKSDHRWKNVVIAPSLVPAGCYYPRIARPTTDHPNDPPIGFGKTAFLEAEKSQSINGLRSLSRLLGEISDVVELDTSNLETYGQKTRNLLILAATEFEAIAKSVLRANSYSTTKTNIRDYAMLEKPMMLSEYRVKFGEYPQVPEQIPFLEWGDNANLGWYSAYNNSKHDRYLNFTEANLQNSIKSLAACFVLLCASFGWREIYGFGNRFGLGMEISKFPEWPLGQQYRRPKAEGGPYIAGDISEELCFKFGSKE